MLELGLDPDLIDSLSDAEQDYLMQCLEEMAETGTSVTAAQMVTEDFRHPVVTMEQFLSDPFYMGEIAKSLYPLVRAFLIDVFDNGIPPMYVLYGGAIGTGKSTAAAVALTYLAFRLTCLKDPHQYYGLQSGSNIYMAVYSVNLDQAMDGIYGKVLNWIDSIPYFAAKCPRIKRVNSSIKFSGSPLEIIVASRTDHTIGKDLIAAALDEINFVRAQGGMSGEEIAEAIYDNTQRRLTSRFMRPGGRVDGMIMLVSSKTSKRSFFEKKLAELKPEITAGKARLFSYAQWEVKPAATYTKPRFQVEIGDRIRPSRVLREGDTPIPGSETVWVPGEFAAEFRNDVDKALRDLAGIATEGTMPLMRDKRPLYDACDATLVHPFTRESITLDYATDLNIDVYFKPETLFHIVRSKYVLRLNPNAPRFLGLDLALTGDCLGMAMCHISGFKTVQRYRPDGTSYDDRAPVVIVDFMLQIKPPVASEIDLSKARAFIQSLRDYGIEIARVSVDTSNSRDMIQTLRKLGFDCNINSVDRTDEAYLALRQGFLEGRIRTYKYEPFINEMSNLERDIEKRKVDHPKTGGVGKDVADAVCQAYWAALKDKRTLLPEVNYRDMVALTEQNSVPVVGTKRVLWDVLDQNTR
jgi:hypothetical protein